MTREAKLYKCGDIKCHFCPYHRVENTSRRKRKAKSDKHKDHRR